MTALDMRCLSEQIYKLHVMPAKWSQTYSRCLGFQAFFHSVALNIPFGEPRDESNPQTKTTSFYKSRFDKLKLSLFSLSLWWKIREISQNCCAALFLKVENTVTPQNDKNLYTAFSFSWKYIIILLAATLAHEL